MNLREYARGKECQIRLPGCSYNPEETILCHHRNSSTGMGQKAHDLQGAWGCKHCHDIVDGRKQPPPGWEGRDVELAFFEGIMRTQSEILREKPGIVSDIIPF